MINQNTPLVWSALFSCFSLYGKHLILLSETEQYLLTGSIYQELKLFFSKPNTINHFIKNHSHRQNLLELITLIEKMVENHFLCIASSPPKIHRINDKSDYRKVIITPKVTVYDLCEMDNTQLMYDSLARIENTGSIVFVNDYLDPRLALINDQHTMQKKPWVLVKPHGDAPLFGPFFNPKIQVTPCWHCLAKRLIKNQPVRQYLMRQQHTDFIAIPIAVYKGQINKLLAKFSFWLDSLQPTSYRTIIDINTQHKHDIMPVKSCAYCGDIDLYAKQLSQPIVLKEQPIVHFDGGMRVCDAQLTVNKLSTLISPMTGAINQVAYLNSQQKDRGIKIYKSSFFKCGFQPLSGIQGFNQVSLGKGLSKAQSKVSALAESMERYNAQYQGDEPYLMARPGDLKERPITPWQLFFFSDQQYQAAKSSEIGDTGNRGHVVIKPYDNDIPLPFINTYSLTHNEFCRVPLTYCYTNTPFEQAQYCSFSSNGCAAGNCLEEAILQGFLELIERDATAIWWYNKLPRPKVDDAILTPDQRRLFDKIFSPHYDYWLLDLTHDFAIPVVCAVAQHRQTGGFTLGFGCHLDLTLASLRALTELCQLQAIRHQHSSPFDFDAIQAEDYLFPHDQTPASIVISGKNNHATGLKQSILWCVKKAQDLGFETLVLNYTRPDYPIFTTKVMIPGLCHIWPQLANPRLYQTPVTLGWLHQCKKEHQLNPLGLFI